jgi:excisionase family DNA binding protein
MTTIATEEVYTVGEVATIFRVPVDTIRRLIARGELPALRLGRSTRVPKHVVTRLLEQPVVSTVPEELGFGMWADKDDQVDSVAYVNSVRDADSRTLSEYVAELCKD